MGDHHGPASRSGAADRTTYRPALASMVLLAGLLGFGGAAVTVSVLRTGGVLCEPGGCPDGIAYVLPGMLGFVVAAMVSLAIGVFLLARRLVAPDRSALAVDLVRLAAAPMLLFGTLAGLRFLTGVLTADVFLPMLGYGAALLVAGLVPMLVRRPGQRVFVATTLALALAALVVAIPAVLVAPLLAGYAGLLLLAAAVAFRSSSDSHRTAMTRISDPIANAR